MKTLIIYDSVHHGNTDKVARAMVKVLNAQLLRADLTTSILGWQKTPPAV